MSRQAVDRDALLCALVLAPTTFARNRFFVLYTEPWARRTRSRAAQLRTMVRHLSAPPPKSELHQVLPLEDGDTMIRYGVPHLHLERTAMLTPLELAAVRFAISRRPRAASEPLDSEMQLTDADRQIVEQALLKLGRKLGYSLVVSPGEAGLHTTPTGET